MNKTMQCPSCGNYVLGKIERSTGSKISRKIVKKGGMKAVGFAAGSIVPGAGNVVGFAAGALLDCVLGDEINKGVDNIVDNFVKDDTYEFVCPKCGKKWTKKYNSLSKSTHSHSSSTTRSRNSVYSNSYSFSSNISIYDDSQILKIICQYAKNKPGNVSATIGTAGIRWNALISRLNNDFGLHIVESQLPHSGQIKDLVQSIQAWANGGNTSLTQPINEKDEFDVENEKFQSEFSSFINQIDDLTKDQSSVNSYVENISIVIEKTKNTIVKSEYYYLQAFCCLYYTFNHLGDCSLISKGEHCIGRAIQLLDDDEYKIVKLMLQSYNLTFCILGEINEVVQQQHTIAKSCPNISNISNSFFKVEYLHMIYEKARFYSLNDTFIKLEELDMFIEAASILKIMYNLNDAEYKIYAADLLSQYYLFGEEGVSPDPYMGFQYAINATNMGNYERDFDERDDFHMAWRSCLANASHCYLVGLGTNVDYQKAYIYAEKAAKLGDEAAMDTLGQLFESGKGVAPNMQIALEWYQKAADLGDEEAIKRLEVLNINTVGTTCVVSKLSEVEQEYIEELKACLENGAEISPRERRLLDRLRINLGITESRALELEASLLTPVLTDEEQEYLSEYKECLSDGVISDKELRLLTKLRKVLGISETRAKELESSIVKEKMTYDVFLNNAGTTYLMVMKIVKETLKIDLKEAKELVESAPTYLIKEVDKATAEEFKSKLENAGAEVWLK